MQFDRTGNSIVNTAWGSIEKFVTLAGSFLVRTVLIYRLSAEYSALSSLFTSILSILSLSELGFSTAIIYSMYKPVAEDDRETVCALLKFYRKVYRVVGSVILCLGLLLLPFLHLFISGDIPADVSLYVLFLIFLFNTVISYFMYAYKTSLLTAYQKQSEISRNQALVRIGLYSFQILMLCAFGSFYIYAVLIPASTVILNLMNSRAADKLFPGIDCRGTLSPGQKGEIKKLTIGIMGQKLGASTRDSFDSVVISMYLGLTAVAIYHNYYLILSSVIVIMNIFITAVTPAVGNKIASESPEENYRDFNKFLMLYMAFTNWAVSCMICLYQPFMRLWMGEALMLPGISVVLICIYFFVLKAGDINWLYYSAAGLWWKGKLRYLIEAALNLSLNLILGYYFGINGVILATIISMSIIYVYSEKLIFRYYFTDYSSSEFFLQIAFYAVSALIVSAVCYALCAQIPAHGGRAALLVNLMIRLLICTVVSGALTSAIFRFNKNFTPALDFLKALLMRMLSAAGVSGRH